MKKCVSFFVNGGKRNDKDEQMEKFLIQRINEGILTVTVYSALTIQASNSGKYKRNITLPCCLLCVRPLCSLPRVHPFVKCLLFELQVAAGM